MSRRAAKSSNRAGVPGFWGTLWRLTVVGGILFLAAGAAGYATVYRMVKTGEVQAPDLLVMNEQEALVAASDQGFAARIGEHEPSNLLESGQVISQSPRPGDWVKPGATIVLTVAE